MTDENKYHNEGEDKDKPYESIQDWLDDISHLKWPMIILCIVTLLLIILFQLKII